MNPKNCTIFALGLLAGSAATLLALPIARREAKRKSAALTQRISKQIEGTVTETAEKTRQGIREWGDSVSTQKKAVLNSLQAAKQAYQHGVKEAVPANA